MADDSQNGAAAVPSVDSLSPRERQVIDLASLGLTNNQIAQRLALTVHAVKFHLATTYRKLGVANRTEAAYVYHSAAASKQGHSS